MKTQRQSIAKLPLRHLAYHGVIALIFAAVALFALHGRDPRALLWIGLPLVVAFLFTRSRFSSTTRAVAWSFLGMIGLGAVVAKIPWLFPHLGGVAPQLAVKDDRMLTWFAVVYLLWLTGVLPLHFFGGSLRAARENRPAHFSRFTCYLGLVTASLFWVGALGLVKHLGFWPIL